MTTPKKPKKKPLATAIVWQGPSMVELDRRLHAAGVDTARVEISIPGVKIPQGTQAFITVVPTEGVVTMFDDDAPINDSKTHPPY